MQKKGGKFTCIGCPYVIKKVGRRKGHDNIKRNINNKKGKDSKKIKKLARIVWGKGEI